MKQAIRQAIENAPVTRRNFRPGPRRQFPTREAYVQRRREREEGYRRRDRYRAMEETLEDQTGRLQIAAHIRSVRLGYVMMFDLLLERAKYRCVSESQL